MSKKQSLNNQKSYNIWSNFYDNYPNSTVAMDELSFPSYWQHVEGKSVLEIGCGTGRHTQKILKKNNKVTGIDISEGMLSVAKEKCNQGNVEFIHGDFLTFDFEGKLFDIVLCSLVIEHITDLHLFFRNIKKCLTAGGRVYISEIHPERSARGVLANFKTEDGNEVRLDSHAHTERDFEKASEAEGFKTVLKETIIGTQQLVNINPRWIKHLNTPLIQVWVFEDRL